MLFAASPPRGNRAFAERFKYIIISSPLLSSSIAPIPLDTPDPLSREDTFKTPRRVARSALHVTQRVFSIRQMVVPIPSTRWLMPIIGATAMASRRITVIVAITAWILKTFYNPTTAKPDTLNTFSTVRITMFTYRVYANLHSPDIQRDERPHCRKRRLGQPGRQVLGHS